MRRSTGTRCGVASPIEGGPSPAHSPGAVPGIEVAPPRGRETLESLIERRAAFLAEYQDAAYADRYRTFVERGRAGRALPCEGDARAHGSGGPRPLQAPQLTRTSTRSPACTVRRSSGESWRRRSRETGRWSSTSPRHCSPGATRPPAPPRKARSYVGT